MPDVRLTRREEEGQLPAVCMGCGDPATAWVQRSLPVRPPIVDGPSGFVEIYAIRVLLAAGKVPRVRLRTSFCSRHRHYWHWRFALQFGGLAGMFAVLFGGLVVVLLLLFVAKIDAPWLSCCVIVPFLVYLVAWIIPFKLVQDRTIRVRRADDESEAVVLANVDARYVEALERQRALAQDVPPTVELVDDDAGAAS